MLLLLLAMTIYMHSTTNTITHYESRFIIIKLTPSFVVNVTICHCTPLATLTELIRHFVSSDLSNYQSNAGIIYECYWPRVVCM